MPVLSGGQACRAICQRWRKCRILIVTATVSLNMSEIFNALSHCAIDYVRSPSLPFKAGSRINPQQLQEYGKTFLNKLKIVCRFTESPPDTNAPSHADNKPPANISGVTISRTMASLPTLKSHLILAIGVSTGGPKTLVRIFNALNGPLKCPILICQHIEPGFEGDFAQWLSQMIKRPVLLAEDKTIMENTIYVARANRNLTVSNAGRLLLELPPEGQIYTPNIDCLFKSLAQHYQASTCAVVLTGMGQDGTKGAKVINQQGGTVLVQDPTTATIESMPKNASPWAYDKHGATPELLAKQIHQFMTGSLKQ